MVARGRSERLAETVDDGARTWPGPATGVAVQLDGGPAPTDLERLRAAGLIVVEVPVYEWQILDDAATGAAARRGGHRRPHPRRDVHRRPQIRNWLLMAAEQDLDMALLEALNAGDVIVGCVGPVCADVAVANGLDRSLLVVPSISRLGPLVRPSPTPSSPAPPPCGSGEAAVATSCCRAPSCG